MSDPRRPGATAAEEILDAAAELFSEHGYAATSTRRIAEAVGIRQASLYHYFATKDEILTALLTATVQEPLALARSLVAAPRDPAVVLLELARADATQLLSARFNLGALYHLPEIGGDAFADFRTQRRELGQHYRTLAGAALGNPEDPRAQLPFRLVEAVIGMRSDGEISLDQPHITALVDAVCRAIGDVLGSRD